KFTYYPYGEEKPTATAQGREKFGTYFRDGTGLDYAYQRFYSSIQGRFLTPDPYRADSGGPGKPAEPATWNRYAYTHGDPVNFYDPLGTNEADPSGYQGPGSTVYALTWGFFTAYGYEGSYKFINQTLISS